MAKIVAIGLAFVGGGLVILLALSEYMSPIFGLLYLVFGLVISYFALIWRSVFLFDGRSGWHILRTRFRSDLRAALRTRFGTRGAGPRSPPA